MTHFGPRFHFLGPKCYPCTILYLLFFMNFCLGGNCLKKSDHQSPPWMWSSSEEVNSGNFDIFSLVILEPPYIVLLFYMEYIDFIYSNLEWSFYFSKLLIVVGK